MTCEENEKKSVVNSDFYFISLDLATILILWEELVFY